MTSTQLERLRHEMERPPFHAFLDPQAQSVDEENGAITIRLAYRPAFARAPDGPGYHGGVIASLVDIAGHAAVAVRIGRMAPTINLRIDYLKVANDGDLIARAKIVHAGRTLALADIEILDQDSRIIAVGRGTYSTAAPVPPT